MKHLFGEEFEFRIIVKIMNAEDMTNLLAEEGYDESEKISAEELARMQDVAAGKAYPRLICQTGTGGSAKRIVLEGPISSEEQMKDAVSETFRVAGEHIHHRIFNSTDKTKTQ